MTDRNEPPTPATGEEPVLAALTEQITRRLEQGEIVDFNQYQQAHPGLAAPIRDLIPMLSRLVELGRVIDPVPGTGRHRKDEECR
jgi:hypothetical protein